MFGLSTTEILLIVLVILLLFGASRLPAALGGLGKGIKEFKKSMKGEDETATPQTGGTGTGVSVADQLKPGLGKHVRLLPDGTLEVGLPEGATLVQIDQTSAVVQGDGSTDRIPFVSVKRIIYRV